MSQRNLVKCTLKPHLRQRLRVSLRLKAKQVENAAMGAAGRCWKLKNYGVLPADCSFALWRNSQVVDWVDPRLHPAQHYHTGLL